MSTNVRVVSLPRAIGSESEFCLFLIKKGLHLASNLDLKDEFFELTSEENGCIIRFEHNDNSFIGRFRHQICGPAFGTRPLPRGQKVLVY